MMSATPVGVDPVEYRKLTRNVESLSLPDIGSVPGLLRILHRVDFAEELEYIFINLYRRE